MRRREFVALFGGLAAWPLAARAQQAGVPRIGALVLGTPDPQRFWREFREAMRDLGYIEGKNVAFEFRTAGGNAGLLAKLALELVQLKVNLIVAYQTPAAQAAKDATKEIPIVIMAGDPVGTGLVTSLARPGGNITGLSGTAADLVGKVLELLREIVPSVRRLAVLANAADPFTRSFVEQLERSAQILGLQVQVLMVRGEEGFDGVFVEMNKSGAEAVMVQPSLIRRQVTDLALKYRLPAVSTSRLLSETGGLMSYSANFRSLHGGLSVYVDKILKGSKPADLPVQQPTTFELVINLKTAKTLGLTVASSLLARADEVIE